MKLFKAGAAAILCACIMYVIAGLAGCSDDNPVVVVKSDDKTLELERRRWVPASPPVDPDGDLIRALDGDMRDNMFWYNIEPQFGTHMRDLNPSLQERDNILVSTLDIEVDTASVDPDVWAGVMTGFDACGLDLREYANLEIWINDFRPDQQDRGGRIYIDIGKIDENFYEPDRNEWNDEDRNHDGFTALTEDTGLDGIFTGNPGDDPDDDYAPERDRNGRFSGINGTEANLLHDTEDIDRSGLWDRKNCYLFYAIDLADSAVVDIRRDFPTYEGLFTPGHERDSWRRYTIDLSGGGAIHLDCSASLCNVHCIRIWFQDVTAVLDPELRRLQIALFKFTK